MCQVFNREEKFLFQFEDNQKRYMSYVLLVYALLKEEVCLEIDDPMLDLTQT